MHQNPPILFTTIDRADRQRQNYDSAYIITLAESIYTSGFIHPICVNPETNRLIAGGCRSAALDFILANPDHFTDLEVHPTMASFPLDNLLHYGIHYTSKTTDSEQEHATLELVENVVRHNLSWQEEVCAIKRIHNLKTADAISKFDTWTQRRTAALLGVTQASISYAITLSTELANPDSPCWKMGSMVEALQHLAKSRHDDASRALVDRIKQRATVVPSITPSTTPISGPSFLSTFDPSKFVAGGVSQVDMGAEFGTPTSSTPTTPSAPITISESDAVKVQQAYEVVSKLVHNMSFEQFCEQVPEESFDHILCDPPYAIDMKNIKQTGTGQKDIDRVAETHDVESNLADIPRWLACCYKILKDKAFCIWFADEEIRPYICAEAIKVGFKVQRWSFVWCKTSVCSNQRAEYNFTKKTEIAIIMRKGDARLIKQQPTNWWAGQLTPEDQAAGVNHPFIKPKELWQHLLKAIALPGSTVVDGFSGVGSSTRAMMLAGYTPIGVEKDEKHYAQQVQNLTRTYCEMNGIKFQ